MFLEGKQFFHEYDLDSVAYKYGRIGDSQGGSVQGKYGVKTSGSSTTVTATTNTIPFSPVKAGDLICFVKGETNYPRKVATKVSSAEITVDTAVNLDPGTGAGWSGWFFYPFKIGATDGDGWHVVTHLTPITVFVRVTTLSAAGGVDVSVEGLTPGTTTPIVLATANYAAPGLYQIPITQRLSHLRVGLKAGSDASGTDSISVWISAEITAVRR